MTYLALLQLHNEDKIRNGIHVTPRPKREVSHLAHERAERAKKRVAQLYAAATTAAGCSRRGHFTVPEGTVAVSGVMDDFLFLDGNVVRHHASALVASLRQFWGGAGKPSPKMKLDGTVFLQESVYLLHHPEEIET